MTPRRALSRFARRVSLISGVPAILFGILQFDYDVDITPHVAFDDHAIWAVCFLLTGTALAASGLSAAFYVRFWRVTGSCMVSLITCRCLAYAYETIRHYRAPVASASILWGALAFLFGTVWLLLARSPE